jgi:hemolysin III
MRNSAVAAPRPQSRGEEIANSVSHGLALLAAIAGLPVLIVFAVERSDAAQVVGVSIFGAAMVALYLASTLYHALPPNRAKRVFYLLDHSAIFLLIAGTYTPFTLGVLRGSWGWTLFGMVWGLAAVGILLKIFGWARHPVVSTGLYLVMGWLVLVAVQPLVTHLPREGLAWLVAGGLAYTLGVAFFVLDERVRYAHFVWHLFVIAGSGCHFVAVLGYAG